MESSRVLALDRQLAEVVRRRDQRRLRRRRLIGELDDCVSALGADEQLIDRLLAARAQAGTEA